MFNQMRSPSDNYKVSGDIQEDINTVSGNIKIKGNLLEGTASSVSGEIKLTGYNSGNLITTSGDIQVGKNNKFIQTTSGYIEGEDNQGTINSVSGDVEFDVNGGEIITTLGDVEVEENNGKIVTTSGDVIIGSINIQQDKMSVNMGNVGAIFSKGVNNVISGNNITIVNGVVVNGDAQGNSSNVGNEKYIVQIDNLEVDYLEKKVFVNGNECDVDELNSSGDGTITINTDNISVIYQGQNIIISDNEIEINAI